MASAHSGSGSTRRAVADHRAASFIEKTPDGIRVLPKAGTKFRRETHGILIRDLAPFKIAWGADLSTIKIDDRGKPRWPDGQEASLVSWPSSPPSGREYTKMLCAIAQEIRGAAPASSPATIP